MANVIIRPQADVSGWQIVGGAASAAAAISRPFTQPDPVDAASYIWAGGTAGAVAAVSCGTPTNLAAGQIGRVWFYANTGADTILLAEILHGGLARGSMWVPPASGFAWRQITFPQDAAAGAQLVLRFTAVGGGDSNVRAAYLELVTAGGDDGPVDPRVQVVGVTDKVRPQDAPAGVKEATLTAAGNEVAAFQVVVQATNAAVGNFSVAAEGPLAGPGGATIPVAAVSIYRVGYVTTVQETSDDAGPNPTGRWPDPLIPVTDPITGEPRNAFPITIPAGENRIAWVEILVPAGLPAGDYSGSVHVTGDGLDTHVPVTLTTLAFSLPVTSRLANAFRASLNQACAALGYDIDTIEGWTTLAMFIRLGLNNRITMASMLPLLRGSSDHRASFEAIILPLINGTGGGIRLAGAQMTSVDVINRGSTSELGAWRDEANTHGFADRAFVYDNDACDEIVGTGKSWPTCRDTRIRTVLTTWPQAAILLTASINDVNTWQTTPNDQPGPLDVIDGAGGRLRLTVVIDQMYGRSGTYAGDQRGDYTGFLTTPNHSLWLYSSCDSWGCGFGPHDPNNLGWAGGYAIDAPGSRSRAMAWLCFRFAVSGELYYDTTAKMTTAWAPGGQWNFGGNGDGNLFYPGTPATDTGDNTTFGGTTAVPVESIRLKLACQGYQDFEYLAELTARGHGAEAQQIATTFFPTPFQVPPDHATYVQARQALITALTPLL
jgi:Domain of unknown function (DUF4091)